MCKKCNSIEVTVSYNQVSNMLDKHCNRCGYSWSEQTADVNTFIKQTQI